MEAEKIAGGDIDGGDIDGGLKSFVESINVKGTWLLIPRSVKQELRDNARTLLGQMNDQDANWNFIIDQGATESFARDRTQHDRPAALVLRFPAMTHQIEFSWDDDYEQTSLS